MGVVAGSDHASPELNNGRFHGQTMIAIGDKKELILLLKKGRGFALACFGTKKHYRKDGSCKHTDDMLSRMKPWHRARTKLDGFGGRK